MGGLTSHTRKLWGSRGRHNAGRQLASGNAQKRSRMATECMAQQRHWRTQEEGCLAHHLQQRRGGIKQLAVAWRMWQGRWQQLASVAAGLVLESSRHTATQQQVTRTRCC